MIRKEYKVQVWETQSDLSSYGNSFYLDLDDCDETNLLEVIKAAENYIKIMLPYALDVVEAQTEDTTILSWEREPLEKIKWGFEGISENEYKELMKTDKEIEYDKNF